MAKKKRVKKTPDPIEELVGEIREINRSLRSIDRSIRDLGQRVGSHPQARLASRGRLWGPYSVEYLSDKFPEIYDSQNTDASRKTLLKLKGVESAGRGKKGLMVIAQVCRQRGIPKTLVKG